MTIFLHETFPVASVTGTGGVGAVHLTVPGDVVAGDAVLVFLIIIGSPTSLGILGPWNGAGSPDGFLVAGYDLSATAGISGSSIAFGFTYTTGSPTAYGIGAVYRSSTGTIHGGGTFGPAGDAGCGWRGGFNNNIPVTTSTPATDTIVTPSNQNWTLVWPVQSNLAVVSWGDNGWGRDVTTTDPFIEIVDSGPIPSGASTSVTGPHGASGSASIWQSGLFGLYDTAAPMSGGWILGVTA